MTGKGDRWGRDSVGRSAPAFMAASTTALPPPTCTARREAGRRHRQLCFCCKTGHLLVVFLRPVPGGASAGCDCLQCQFSRLCACSPFACHAHCPQQFAPRSSLLCPVQFIVLCPCSFQVRQDHPVCCTTVCKLRDCPVGSCNTGLQWRPVRRFIC